MTDEEKQSPQDQEPCLAPVAVGPEPEAEPAGSEAAGAGQAKVETSLSGPTAEQPSSEPAAQVDTSLPGPKAEPTSSEPADSGIAKAAENTSHHGMSLSGMSKSIMAPKARTPEQLPNSSEPAAKDSMAKEAPSGSKPAVAPSSSKPAAKDETQAASKAEKDREAKPMAVVEEKPTMNVAKEKDQDGKLEDAKEEAKPAEVIERRDEAARPAEAKVEEAKPAEAREHKTMLQKAEEALHKVEEKVEHAKEAIKEAVHHHPAAESPAPQTASDSMKLTEAELNAPDGSIWVVVGGEDKGGIVTRKGENFTSPILSRLSTGARVKQLELKGDRLHYQLINGTGSGAEFGWVSLRIKGKRLVVLAEDQQ